MQQDERAKTDFSHLSFWELRSQLVGLLQLHPRSISEQTQIEHITALLDRFAPCGVDWRAGEDPRALHAVQLAWAADA